MVKEKIASRDEYGEEISPRLHEIRGKRSIREWAAELGIPANTLTYYLRGKTPPASLLAQVCQREGVDPGWLLFGTPSLPDHPVFRALANTMTLARYSSDAQRDFLYNKLKDAIPPDILDRLDTRIASALRDSLSDSGGAD